MSETGTPVTIRRERGFYGILRALRINVDGQEILRIKSGQQVKAVLPQGAQALTMQMDWVSTDPFALNDVRGGDTLVITVQKRSFAEMRSQRTIPFAVRIVRS